MYALAFDQFGGPEVLEWRRVADPLCPMDGAIVRITVAGLNFADIYRRRGSYHMDASPPWILGYEGAGEIVALTPDGERQGFAIGDRVGFADVAKANAELVAAPLDRLIPLPPDIADAQAAALMLQGLTAQYLVSDSYRVRKGDLAVVHAAGGGVGLLLTQMLVSKGATVAALASTEDKRTAAKAAGAIEAFAYEGDWPHAVRQRFGAAADVVYDSVGSTLMQSLEAARTGGVVVFYGFAGGAPALIDPRLLMDRSLTVTGGDLWNVLTGSDERRRRAAELFRLVRGGAVVSRVGASFSMSDGAAAHQLLGGRTVIGKVLLTI